MDYNKDLTMESDFIGQFNPIKRRGHNSNNNKTVSVQEDTSKPFLIACGGLTEGDIPSHTIAAIVNAAKDGYKWVDLRVVFTKDNIPVLSENTNMEVYQQQEYGRNINPVLKNVTVENEDSVDLLYDYTYDEAGTYRVNSFDHALSVAKQYGLNVIISFFGIDSSNLGNIFDTLRQYDMLNNCIVCLGVQTITSNANLLQQYHQVPICITFDEDTYGDLRDAASNIEKPYISIDADDNFITEVLSNALALELSIIGSFDATGDGFELQKIRNVLSGVMSYPPVHYRELKDAITTDLKYSHISTEYANSFTLDYPTITTLITGFYSYNNFANVYTRDPNIASVKVQSMQKNDNTGTFTTAVHIVANEPGCTTCVAYNGTFTKRLPVCTTRFAFLIGSIDSSNHFADTKKSIVLLSTAQHSITDVRADISEASRFKYSPGFGWWGKQFSKFRIPTGTKSFTVKVPENSHLIVSAKFYNTGGNAAGGSGWITDGVIELPTSAVYIVFIAKLDTDGIIDESNYQTILQAFTDSINDNAFSEMLGAS